MTLSTVGVVGDGALPDLIREVIEADGATVVCGSSSDVLAADPDAVIAVGETALLGLVHDGVDVPVLPVATGRGYGGVPADDATRPGGATRTDDAVQSDVASAVETLLAGEYEIDDRALLDVAVGGERVGRALADVMLVTTEPARISEYAVATRGTRVSQFRADGVVVSTPTGSHGYGRSAGGPLLAPDSGVVGVVPVAPFAVNTDHWVLSADWPVTLTVERDEGEVSLLVDDRTVCSVRPDTPVEVVEDGTLDVVRVPESRPFFER